MMRLTSVVAALAMVTIGGSLALIGERRREGAKVVSALASTAPAPRAAAFRDVTIPVGTMLPLILAEGAGSATSRIDDPIHAHLARPIAIGGLTALPQGSEVVGIVTSAARSEKVKGRAHISIRFDSVRPLGLAEQYDIRTATITRTAPGTMKKDVLTVALPAAGGAILGGVLGGGKGAAIGGAAGGGAGAAYTLNKRGPDVRFAGGSQVSTKLLSPITVRVPVP